MKSPTGVQISVMRKVVRDRDTVLGGIILQGVVGAMGVVGIFQRDQTV